MQTPQNVYKITNPSLDLCYLELWPWNTLTLSDYKMLLPLSSLPSLCSKHLQNHSSPVLFPLCSPSDTFCPFLDNPSSTHLSAVLSSLSFLGAALLKPLSSLLPFPKTPVTKVDFLIPSAKLFLQFYKSLLRWKVCLSKVSSQTPASISLLLQTHWHYWIENYKGTHEMCPLILLTVKSSGILQKSKL